MGFDRFFNGSKSSRFLIICAGSVLFGLSIGLFFSPNSLAPGGISGIAVMLSTFLPMGAGTLTILINIPLLIVAIIKWGRKFLISTIWTILLSGIVADLCIYLPPITEDKLLAALAGGAVMGIGLGFVFRCGSTTGGTDIVMRLIRQKRPHLKLNAVLFAIDGVIAITSGFVFNDVNVALYSLLSLLVSSKVLDMILYGADSARMIFVISEKSDEILENLLNRVGTGCTVLKGMSGYRNKDIKILMCTVRKQLLPSAKDMILDIDNRAFMLVTNAAEVFGEGFKTKQSEFY